MILPDFKKAKLELAHNFAVSMDEKVKSLKDHQSGQLKPCNADSFKAMSQAMVEEAVRLGMDWIGKKS